MNPDAFPHLAANGVIPIAPADGRYNCIAWAAGQTDVWWWPDADGMGFWPDAVPRIESIESFAAAFGTLGYERCDSGDLETGWEKIALYSSADGTPTHAARQRSDGTWSSKLGRGPLVSHNTPHGVEGPVYGRICCYFRRRVG